MKLTPRKIVTIVSLAGLIAVAAFVLAKEQFVPRPAKQNSIEFIKSIQTADFARAMQVADPQLATSANELESKVRNEIGDPTLIEGYEINFVHPKQSYGNRLRRWYRNQALDSEPLSVDFTLIGHGGSLVALFEVRIKRKDDGQWRVVFIQSHAG